MVKIFRKIIFVLLLLFITIPSVFALDVKTKKIELKEKSDTIKIGNYGISGETINSNILFKNKGDYVTFKITVDIDPNEYEISSISDNNDSKFIKSSYTYDDASTIYLTLKYESEVESKWDLEDFELSIEVLNQDGKVEDVNIIPKEKDLNIIPFEITNPNTKDAVMLCVISLIIIIFIMRYSTKLKGKRYINNVLLLLLVVIPISVLAKQSSKKMIVDTSMIKVGYDVSFNKGEDVNGQMDTIECIYGEDCVLPKNIFEKEEKLFLGWSTTEDGEVEFLDEDVVKDLIAGGLVKLYPLWKIDDRVPLLDVGKIVNTKIKLLYTGGEYSNQSLEDDVSYIFNIERVYEEPDIINFTDTNIISSPDSKETIYAWYDYDVDGIQWYAKSDIVYLNEDSSYLFAKMSMARITDLDKFDTSLMKDASHLFENNLEESYDVWSTISNWDVSNVTNMSSMFKGITGMYYSVISNWDVSNVEDMSYMFDQAFNIDTAHLISGGLDASAINDWDVRKVKNFKNMFRSQWVDLPLITFPQFTKVEGFWDNSEEYYGTSASSYYYSGTYVPINPYTLNLNGNGSTAGTMNGKICNYDYDCIIPLNAYSRDNYTFEGWSDTADGEVKYKNGRSIKLPDGSDNTTLYAIWGPKRTVTVTLEDGYTFNKKAKLIEYGETKYLISDYYYDYYGTPINIVDEGYADYNSFIRTNTIPDNSNFTSLNEIYSDDSDGIMYIWAGGNYDEILYYYTDADVAYFNKDSSKMFKGFTYFDPYGQMRVFNTSKVTNMSEMFSNALDYEFNLSEFKYWDVSNVTDLSYMFKNYLGADMYYSDFSNSIGEWDVRKVTNFTGMFSRTENGGYALPSFKSLPGRWVGNIRYENYEPYEEGTYYVINIDPNGGVDSYYGRSYIICFVDQDCVISHLGGFVNSGHTALGLALTPDGEVVYHRNDVVHNLTTDNEITLYVKWS